MNCKVGDMAVITRGEARDRIVEVKAPYGDYLHLGFCWYVEAPTPIPGRTFSRFGRASSRPDGFPMRGCARSAACR